MCARRESPSEKKPVNDGFENPRKDRCGKLKAIPAGTVRRAIVFVLGYGLGYGLGYERRILAMRVSA
jgi:hypothetical protein